MDPLRSPTITNNSRVILSSNNGFQTHAIVKKRGWVSVPGCGKIDLAQFMDKSKFGETYEVDKAKQTVKRVSTAPDKADDADFDSGIATDAKGKGKAGNRSYNDDNSAQKLSSSDIESMISSGHTGEQIIGALTEHSTTYTSKMEYTQVKYIEKKKQKYLPTITLVKPTAATVCDLLMGSNKGMIRVDALARMISLANVQAGGRVLVSETSQGVVNAAVLERLGGIGRLLHVFVGNKPGSEAVKMVNFSEEHKLIMSHFPFGMMSSVGDTDYADGGDAPSLEKQEELGYRISMADHKARKLLRPNSFDSLIIAVRGDCIAVFKELLSYLALGRPFVVYSPHIELLVGCVDWVRTRGYATRLEISETIMREYQVLPGRTHPVVANPSASGYILYGVKTLSERSTVEETAVDVDDEKEKDQLEHDEPDAKKLRTE